MITVSRELLLKIEESLESRCGTNAPERREILPQLRELLEQPAVEPSAVFYRCNHCGHGYEDQPPSSCDCSTGYGFERVEYFTAPQAQQPRIGTGTSVEQTLEQWEHDFSNPMTTEQQADWVKREREFAARQAQQPQRSAVRCAGKAGRKAVKLSDEQVGMLTVFDGLHHVETPLLAEFIRAIEQAVLEKLGVEE